MLRLEVLHKTSFGSGNRKEALRMLSESGKIDGHNVQTV